MSRPKRRELAPPLNPKFSSIIPDFLEQAAQARNAISPLLAQLGTEFGSIRDHIEFEIEKARLTIQRADWEGTPQKPSRETLVAHVAELELTLASLQPERLVASIEAIKAVSRNVETLSEHTSPPMAAL